MAATHTKTQSQRDARKAEVARLHARGVSGPEIAERLGMTKQTVSYWLAQIDAEAAALVTDLAAQKRRELLSLNEVERTAWEGWDRSQQDAETITERALMAEGQEPGAATVIETKRQGQAGDPQFLKRVIEAGEGRRKLLGLDAPTKQEVTADVAVKGYARVSPDDWDQPAE